MLPICRPLAADMSPEPTSAPPAPYALQVALSAKPALTRPGVTTAESTPLPKSIVNASERPVAGSNPSCTPPGPFSPPMPSRLDVNATPLSLPAGLLPPMPTPPQVWLPVVPASASAASSRIGVGRGGRRRAVVGAADQHGPILGRLVRRC